ncbi:MAG TPA: hypothetical protein P5204_13535, partial [Kiritimatiellia bacterium]|nr:hypothetical protein [Kiritimatiellia bacterium]
MIRLLPIANRLTAVAMICLLAFAKAAVAREFSIQQLSPPGSNVRTPSIGATGLVAWQGYTAHEGDSSLATRPDVLHSPPDATRSDI